SDTRSERGAELLDKYSVRYTTDNLAAVSGAKIIVLSVKPQVLHSVMTQLAGQIAPDALVLSIVAGARMEVITHVLQHKAVVRAMPNTPAQIGLGMTVWTCSETLSQVHRDQAKAVFGSIGEEVYANDERYLDMATALSGTGPAYVFLFMEAMIDAGVHMGFSRNVSEQLVYQTVRGSVEYARQNKQHLAAMRNQVTSPGGTSAEALYQIEKGGLRTVMSRAIWAAYQKSRKLGRGVEED
ncbi:MAG TPA: pyrroline-5-carboxylate reductase, partial [Anaerolineae bacterium]